MYAIPEKKKWYQMINLKYTVRNSTKTKLNKQKTKEHMKCIYMYVYMYDFCRSVVTDN